MGDPRAGTVELKIQGVSTRSVDDLVQAMGMSGISKSQVSRLCGEIDDKIQSFLDRPLEGDWPYLWLDATYLKPPEVARRRRPEPQHEVGQEPVEGVARDVGAAAALDPAQQQPSADAGNEARHELVGGQAQQGGAHQRGGLVDGPEQPAFRIVKPARDGMAGGVVHDRPLR